MGVLKRGWKVVHSALASTSLKGVPRILKAKEHPLRVLWFICTLGFFVFVTHQVTLSLDDYFAYRTVTDIKEVIPDIGFPVVTLCNMRPVHRVGTGNLTVQDYIRALEANSTAWNLIKHNASKVERSAYDHLHSTEGFYEFIGTKTARSYGMRLEDFIVDCTVTSEVGKVKYDCFDIADIHLIPDPLYFNCFEISFSEESIMKYLPTSVALVLFLNSTVNHIPTGPHQYTDANDLLEQGVQMMLHTKEGSLNIQRKGISVPPGFQSRVKFNTIIRNRLGDPYGTCIENTTDKLIGLDGKTLPYSKEACYSACIQTNITQKCHCLGAITKAVYSLDELSFPFCAGPHADLEARIQFLSCAVQVENSSSFDCHVKCKIQCKELEFDSSVSLSTWPRLSHHLSFYDTSIINKSYAHRFSEYQRIKDEYLVSHNVTETLKELHRLGQIQNNFLKIDIVRENIYMTIVSEKVKTSIQDVISKVGSLLNLYSGITLIVVVEILDLLYSLACCFLCKESEEKDGTSQNKPNGTNTTTKC